MLDIYQSIYFGVIVNNIKKIQITGDFPDGPVVKTPHFHCRFDPWSGD